MRISDWSSDVCASDLGRPALRAVHSSSGGFAARRPRSGFAAPSSGVGGRHGRERRMGAKPRRGGTDLQGDGGARRNGRRVTNNTRRAEGRREGEGGGRTGWIRWAPDPEKTKRT